MQYEIFYSKTKHAYVRLLPDMTLKLTIPIRKSKDKKLENILLEKWKILVEKYKNKKSQKIETINDDYVLIFWEKVSLNTINWDIKKYLKEKLYNESLPILEKYSSELKIPYNKLTIKDLKSKWGSCSWTNNITLNLKLIHLPVHFLQYVIVHEACHLKEKNHSKRFWDLVWKYFPEFKIVRKELKWVSF